MRDSRGIADAEKSHARGRGGQILKGQKLEILGAGNFKAIFENPEQGGHNASGFG